MPATRPRPPAPAGLAAPAARAAASAALLAAAALCAALAGTASAQPAAQARPLAAAPALARTGNAVSAFDGVVEAVRQTVVAAQVPGAVVQLDAKVGDRVQAGQLLLRIDARAAEQNAAASDAQVQAARAALELATRDFERQTLLHQQHFISKAALERAQSQFRASQAQAQAQLAQAGAARTQSGFYTVRAPFAGVVTDVPVALGDMAMPGRPLLTLVDPTALRVTAAVPQSVAAAGQAPAALRLELPGLAGAAAAPTPLRVQVLPTIDPATHTVQLRADLPPGLAGVVPGMFARVWLTLPPAATGPGTAPAPAATLLVPQRAIVRRAEMTGLYVLDPQGRPVLRQVRLGRSDGERIEVLAGLAAGEQVVSDPQAAARVR